MGGKTRTGIKLISRDINFSILGRDEDAISIGSPSNLVIDDEDLPELVELECNSEPTEATVEVAAEVVEGTATDQATLSGPEAENAVEVDGGENKNPVRQADDVDQFHQELQALAKPPKRVVKSKVNEITYHLSM